MTQNKIPYSSTRVLIRSSFGRITLRIESNGSPRARRTFVLALIRELSPALRAIIDIKIFHDDADWSQWIHAENRDVSLAQAPCIGDKLGQLGFSIRMQRLKLGRTQENLAERVGITASYLSQIEKGKHRPLPQTLKRIQTALSEFSGTQQPKDRAT